MTELQGKCSGSRTALTEVQMPSSTMFRGTVSLSRGSYFPLETSCFIPRTLMSLVWSYGDLPKTNTLISPLRTLRSRRTQVQMQSLVISERPMSTKGIGLLTRSFLVPETPITRYSISTAQNSERRVALTLRSSQVARFESAPPISKDFGSKKHSLLR